MVSANDPEYKAMISEEARIWSENAHVDEQRWLPDWRVYRETWPYRTYRRRWTELMLDEVRPGSDVLEIGCGVGWFALELARRGSRVTALDVADGTLSVAKDYLAILEKSEELPGSLHYELRDVTLEGIGTEAQYDYVVTRGVLHHLPAAALLLDEVAQALRPGGLLLVDDGRTTGRWEAAIVGALLTVLPTDMSYRKKLSHLWRNRRGLVSRAQSFVDREGDSPFEGVTGDADDLIKSRFEVSFEATFAAFTGSLASQVKLPSALKLSLLTAASALDSFLVRYGVLHGSCFLMFARNASSFNGDDAQGLPGRSQ